MFDLEQEITNTDWLVEKVKTDQSYAQNLYAALCNNAFQKLEVVPVLKDEVWTCTWRYAGGLVAGILEEGDYLNWYCSGMLRSIAEEELDGLSEEAKAERLYKHDYFVSEGFVTDEIRDDLKKIGWIVMDGYYGRE